MTSWFNSSRNQSEEEGIWRDALVAGGALALCWLHLRTCIAFGALPSRDRIFLLTLEEELIKYVQDINR